MYDKIFVWDKYSDQPHIIRDKAFKKKMKKKFLGDQLKILLTFIITFPIATLLMKLFKAKKYDKNQFYGMSVNLDKGEDQVKLIEELGVKNLLIRMPLSDIKSIDKYVEFTKSFGDDKSILINILQDRENIDDETLLLGNVEEIFSKFSSITKEFQIGSTINRTKWGFFSTVEYLEFYKKIYDLRNKKYPNIILVGPSVIDFEYHYTARALFNSYDIKYDRLSSLLYVDRRGGPDNTQMGIFDTKNKVNLLYSYAKLSPKTTDDIYITEVNWPLSNTAPYAPTSEHECVSEDLYDKYMLEYYDIVKKTNKVKRVYWHQLIAPGYGLVDNRDGKIRKTKAFYSFKKMLEENS